MGMTVSLFAGAVTIVILLVSARRSNGSLFRDDIALETTVSWSDVRTIELGERDIVVHLNNRTIDFTFLE
jgi:hypothetical protein